MCGDTVVVGTTSFVGPSTWDEPMFNDLFHGKSVTGVVDHAGHLSEQFGDQVRSKACLWKLHRVQVLDLECRVQCEHLLEQVRDFGMVKDRLVVTLDCSDRNDLLGKPFRLLRGHQAW